MEKAPRDAGWRGFGGGTALNRTLAFGGQVGRIVQTAYVVKDMRAAIDWWANAGQTGPWFLLDHFWGPDQRYRGGPSQADVAIAMSFSGSMCIELIQPLDDHPSIYRDGIEKRGYGLHHLGLAVEDSDAALLDYQAKGYAEVFRARVPSGGEVIYLENGVDDPGYLELIPATAGMEEMFTRYAHAARDWDGREVVRPFG